MWVFLTAVMHSIALVSPPMSAARVRVKLKEVQFFKTVYQDTCILFH